MNSNEYFDSDEGNYQYYTSKAEREKLYTKAYKEKLLDNKKKSRRAKLIIIIDLLLLLGIFLFFKYLYPSLLSTKKIEAFQFRLMPIATSEDKKNLGITLNIKRTQPSSEESAATISCQLGDQKKATFISLPTIFRENSVSFLFPLDESSKQIIINIEVGETSRQIKMGVKNLLP